ncbi:MAG: gamma-glutamylcyclotransferase [Rhodobacteraceae bacterium]|jgi:hypothetical protein|nr:gamma-glutamylcyclotransferase [Paracoccaceae bacterium]|tara:strand:- start:1643 stop:2098 length:456 start_codon:yes stop_codon:yes gene_type:complete
MNIFIFGTLMDKALLEIVLGRKVELVSATLKDYGVFKVMDADYPVMIKSVGLVANGIILNELTKMDILRTDFYEHIFDYFLKPVQVLSKEVLIDTQVYMPSKMIPRLEEPWSLKDWQEVSGERTHGFAKKVMTKFGVLSVDEMKKDIKSYF